MDPSTELARLEQFVSRLLESFNALKEKQARTEEALRAKERECEELTARVNELSEEKTHVTGRVAGLLQQIEQWESMQGGDAVDGGGESGAGQGALFGPEGDQG